MFTPPASPLPTHTNPLDASPPSSLGSPSPPRLSPISSSLSPSLSPSPSPSPTSSQPPPTSFRPKSADDFVLNPPPSQRARALSESLDTTRARKRRLARRTTMTVLLVPLALVLITLSTRYAAHPAFFDCFSGVDRDGGASEVVGANDWTTWHGASTHQHGLEHERRQVAGGVATASGATGSIGSSLVFPTATPSGSTSTTPTSSTSVPKIPSTPPVLPTPFPQPFDTTMVSNFSMSACGDFVSNMTGTSAFRDCRAFSFLSQVSQEFLTAQTNVSDLNVDVWGTCNTKLVQDQCVANMAWFADNLQEQCKEDLAHQNAMVVQSLQSLQLYDLLRQTACLADAKTGAYCYVEAAASTDPYDLYLYSLPFGTSVPPSSTPSCSTCSQSVLALFAEQATAFDGLRKTYNVAASSANAQCGAGYVALASGLPTSAAVANGARGGARRVPTPGVVIAVLGAVLGAVSALLSYVL